MSRRFSNNQRPRVPQLGDNVYQTTTLPVAHNYNPKHGQFTKETTGKSSAIYATAVERYDDIEAHDTCFSDDTFTDTNTYYEYCQDHNYQAGLKKIPGVEYYSDESGSTRIPYYEYDDVSLRRHSRNTFSDRSFNRSLLYRDQLNPVVHKDAKKIYPKPDNICDRLCQDNERRVAEVQQTLNVALPNRGPVSRISDRPQSSHSSEVTSIIVDGCGGRCQTFENVCYYFLQVAFTMGILIGTSLSLAGALLRKSAARNLQVLVYIGALLSLVSALLLGVQCSARNSARMRKQALRNSKRNPIPLDNLQNRAIMLHVPQQQPLILEDNTQRYFPSAAVPVSNYNQIQVQRVEETSIVEQPGVPWWRRKDLA